MQSKFLFPASRPLMASAIALVLSVGLSGCIETDDDNANETTTITGTAVAGAVDGNVIVTDNLGNEIVVGTVTDGVFSVTLVKADLAKALRFIVTGSYVDEASGDTVTLSTAHPLALSLAAGHFDANDASHHAPVSPGSTVIHHLVNEQGMSLTAAQTAFQDAFGYLPSMDAVPFDPSLVDEAAAALRPQADKDAAFRAGALSQLATDLGLSDDDIAGLLAGLAEDLADGSLDGRDDNGAAVMVGSSAPINLQMKHQATPLDVQMIQAYGSFAGSANNASGLAAPSMGLPTMAYDAPGSSKTVTLADGRVANVALATEYSAPFMNGFWTARVNHKIILTDSADGSPIDVSSDSIVKGVGNKPFMYMLSGHNHGAPHDHMADSSQAASGIYNLNSYYLMASAMGMGEDAMPMGVWESTVKIKQDTDADGEADTTASVVFHPQVKMPMDGSVLFSKLSNADHTWTTMMGMTKAREYRVWLHDVSPANGGGHDLSVFVSTQNMADMMNMQSMSLTRMGMGMGDHSGDNHSMMSFPAAYSGQSLNGPLNEMDMRPSLTLASVAVEVSVDDGTTWQSMSETADTGRFSITGLAGLSNSEANTLAFRLTVNDGSADYVMTTAAGGNAELIFVAPTL